MTDQFLHIAPLNYVCYVNCAQIKVASLPHQQQKHNHGLRFADVQFRTDPGSVSVATEEMLKLTVSVVSSAL